MADTDTKEKFIELRAEGNSYSTISREIGISKPTLIKWSRELEYEIANLRAISLEAVREQYKATKIHRIKLLGSQLQKIQDELEKRDLTDVPTPKLIDLLVKLSTELNSDQDGLELTIEGLVMPPFTHSWVG